MPRFAANLTMMYPELPFLDRFEAAAKDGFKAVEYLFPYAFPKAELAARLRANGLQQVLFNAPPGGTDAVSIAPAWRWRWTTHRCWIVRASTSWPACFHWE
jgi:hydroxypyruvate isomerase